MLLDEYNDQSRSLGALTALGRTDWAKIRSDHLMSGVNKRSLDALESAIFHVNFLFLALHFGSYFRVGWVPKSSLEEELYGIVWLNIISLNLLSQFVFEYSIERIIEVGRHLLEEWKLHHFYDSQSICENNDTKMITHQCFDVFNWVTVGKISISTWISSIPWGVDLSTLKCFYQPVDCLPLPFGRILIYICENFKLNLVTKVCISHWVTGGISDSKKPTIQQFPKVHIWGIWPNLE